MEKWPRPLVEILAPAGNETCLTAALQGGADAVYFGVEAFNMRAKAANFSMDGMPGLVERAHMHGARAYLTANTIIYEEELPKLDAMMAQAAEAGVDAVIAWDMSVLQAAKRHSVPVMLSTQASVANTETLRFYHEQFGIRRYVLARECSLEQIRMIRGQLEAAGLESVELEAFAHGAMCVAISGRCFMSYYQHGKSANRGECLQPCRREYGIRSKDGDLDFDLGRDYVMSPKDLCTLPFVEQLIDAGIHSFKIEGRNRNPEYVSLTTKAYRRVVDYYLENHSRADEVWREEFAAIKSEEMAKLDSVYHRGFSDGFYHGQPLNEWTDVRGSAASHKKLHLGRVLNYFGQAGVAHIRIESRGVRNGEVLMIQGPSTGVLTLSCESMRIADAIVDVSKPGEEITIPVSSRVRRGDKVFVRVADSRR